MGAKSKVNKIVALGYHHLLDAATQGSKRIVELWNHASSYNAIGLQPSVQIGVQTSHHAIWIVLVEQPSVFFETEDQRHIAMACTGHGRLAGHGVGIGV